MSEAERLRRALAMRVLYGDKLPDMVVAVRVELGVAEGAEAPAPEAFPGAGMFSVSVRAYVEATLPPVVEMAVLRAFGEHIRDEERQLFARYPELANSVLSMGKLERTTGEEPVQ